MHSLGLHPGVKSRSVNQSIVVFKRRVPRHETRHLGFCPVSTRVRQDQFSLGYNGFRSQFFWDPLGKQCQDCPDDTPPPPVRARTEWTVWYPLTISDYSMPSANHWHGTGKTMDLTKCHGVFLGARGTNLELVDVPLPGWISRGYCWIFSSWTHLEAQAQQLTESNEQMAPQAKDAGKSERSWVSSGGFAAGRLDAIGCYWMLVKTLSSSWKKLRPPVFWLGPPVCFGACLQQEDLNSDCLAWPESTSSWSF